MTVRIMTYFLFNFTVAKEVNGYKQGLRFYCTATIN
jgi:hypothetical protein